MKFIINGYLAVFKAIPNLFAFWKWDPASQEVLGGVLAVLTIISILGATLFVLI